MKAFSTGISENKPPLGIAVMRFWFLVVVFAWSWLWWKWRLGDIGVHLRSGITCSVFLGVFIVSFIRRRWVVYVLAVGLLAPFVLAVVVMFHGADRATEWMGYATFVTCVLALPGSVVWWLFRNARAISYYH
jgi:hypothetical protein